MATPEPVEPDTPLEEPATEPTPEPGTELTPDEEEEHEDTEPTPAEPETTPEASFSVKDVDAALERLAKEETRHSNRISEIMGEDAQMLVKCELCAPAIPGFRWPVPPDPEQTQAVLIALGQPPRPSYKPDNYSRACDACDGLGEVETGSKVHGKETLPCYVCKGNGWTPVGTERAGAGGYVPPVTTPSMATENGEQAAAPAGPAPPEVEALRAQGYVVLDPVRR